MVVIAHLGEGKLDLVVPPVVTVKQTLEVVHSVRAQRPSGGDELDKFSGASVSVLVRVTTIVFFRELFDLVCIESFHLTAMQRQLQRCPHNVAGWLSECCFGLGRSFDGFVVRFCARGFQFVGRVFVFETDTQKWKKK